MTDNENKRTNQETPSPPKEEPPKETQVEQEENKQDKKDKKEEKKQKKNKKDEEISALKEEVANLKEQLMRNQAELQNFKRRTNEERIKERKYANSEFTKALLPILDNFSLALDKEQSNLDESTYKGFEMIKRNLQTTLEEQGLQPVNAEGEPFDPNYHQAVMTEPRDDVAPNTVVEEFQKGYVFKERLLRPSMVKVSEKLKESE